MPHRKKCAYCERPAVAYRLEADGEKVPLCEAHIPAHDIDSQAKSPADQSPRKEQS